MLTPESAKGPISDCKTLHTTFLRAEERPPVRLAPPIQGKPDAGARVGYSPARAAREFRFCRDVGRIFRNEKQEPIRVNEPTRASPAGPHMRVPTETRPKSARVNSITKGSTSGRRRGGAGPRAPMSKGCERKKIGGEVVALSGPRLASAPGGDLMLTKSLPVVYFPRTVGGSH